MKKLFVLFFALFMVAPTLVHAQNDNSVATQVDQLKDKVASKVAQLKLVEKRGAIGKVVEVGSNSFTVEDINGNNVLVTVDELTDYTSDENTSFAFSDIKKGVEISLLGLYNKDSEKILARFVNETTIPLFLRGVIVAKDAKNSTYTLNTMDGTSYTIDDENITKDFIYDQNDLTDTTFSKMPTMVNALVTGFENPKEKGHITASRIIVFPDTPKDPLVPTTKNEVSPTTTK